MEILLIVLIVIGLFGITFLVARRHRRKAYGVVVKKRVAKTPKAKRVIRQIPKHNTHDIPNIADYRVKRK